MRKPAREVYDAVVELSPRESISQLAYALVKVTYSIEAGGRLKVEKPLPLMFDVFDPNLEPKMPPGSDFWPYKLASDVVMIGSAFAPGGKARKMTVNLQVGNRNKSVAVFGKRVVTWQNNKPTFSEPEPFESIELDYSNAYGGADVRVPVEGLGMTQKNDALLAKILEIDHPGLYPRNPFGKGYLVDPRPANGVQLPNLEDPTDLLTPERIIVGDPKRWHLQPLPWSYGFTNLLMFPRGLYFDIEPWYPAPLNEHLLETKRGFLNPAVLEQIDAEPNPRVFFYQEASFGMIFNQLEAGTPIVMSGVHPTDKDVSFVLPPPPKIDIIVEGNAETCPAQITNLVLLPNEKKFAVVYIAKRTKLPRSFIPGVHKNIPLSVSVNKDAPIAYASPPTIREQLNKANPKK